MLNRLKRATFGLPKNFWYLWWANLINRSGAFVAIVLSFYLHQERGFEPGLVGLIVGLIGAGGTVGALLGGQLADRWGRRGCLVLAQSLTAAMLVLVGFGRQPWLLAVAALLLGLGQSMARPAFSAMMIDIVPNQDRVRAFSLNYWANNLAFTIAALLGGFIAEHTYTAVFLADAFTTLVMAFVVFVKVPESKPDVPPPSATRASELSPFRDTVFLGLCGLAFLGAVVFLQYISTLPLAMNEDGISAKVYGIVMSINAIMIVAGQLFVSDLVKHWDRTKNLAATSVIVGVGFGLTALADNAWMYALSVVIWTVGEMLQSPAASTTLAELSPRAARARYQSVFSLSISAAAFIAPTLGGSVFQRFGNSAVWAGCLVVGVLAALLTLAAGPSRARRIEELRDREASPVPTVGATEGA